jgi:hypothetical protein
MLMIAMAYVDREVVSLAYLELTRLLTIDIPKVSANSGFT